MDKFEVYNRKTNTWRDDNVELISGWNENFVLDKTTDNASVKIKYRGLQRPEWDIGDWCRLIHLTGDETTVTHTRKGIPSIRNLNTAEYFTTYADINDNNERVVVIEMTGGNYVSEEIVGEFYIDYSNSDYQSHFTDTKLFTFNAENDYKAYYTISGAYNKITIHTARMQNFVPDKLRSYEDIYLPLNYEQYVISNITMVEDKINEEIDIQLDLGEPINIANGILCETMSFTNQIEKKVDDVIYTHEPLNHLSVLEKILKVTPANTDTYEEGYDPKKNKSWFNRIKIIDKELLASIPFNDETYNEPTLYEILLNKYDSSVGRTPVLYFDVNKNGNPNNTARTEYILYFERQDGFDKEQVTLDELKADCKEIVINKSGENYSKGIVSNYDNLSPNSNIISPSETLWLIPEVNTNQRDTTQYNEDNSIGNWILRTPHSIKKINKVERFYIGGYYEKITSGVAEEVASLDRNLISYSQDQILEEKQYNASDKYFNKRDCVWYKEGTNIIYVNEVYYKKIEQSGLQYASKTWIYRITYEPFVSGRFDLAEDYQTQINQVDAQVDSYKFGKYLEQYLASMNKSDITILKTVSNFNEIEELGKMVIDNDSTFIITNVSIQNRGFDYDVIYQLNENHVRRSDTIQASNEIRKNIEISVDATKERKSILPFSAGISYKIENKEFYKTNLKEDDKKEILLQMFSQLLEKSNELEHNKIQLAHITFNSELIKSDMTREKISISRLCEIARFYLNNTICLNMKYFDNAEAGKTKDLENFQVNFLGTTFYAMPKKQVPVLYTDAFGEFNTFNVDFIKIGNRDISTIIPDTDLSGAIYQGYQIEAFKKYLDEVNKELNTMADYPLTTSVPKEDLDNPIAKIENIQYYKDMLDTFNYTIAFNYKTDKNIILCKGFFEKSPLMYGNSVSQMSYKIFNKNITEEDLKIEKEIDKGNIYYSDKVEEDVDGILINKITYTTLNSLGRAKSIVLIEDETNKPLLIVNNLSETGRTFSIYHS